MPRPIRVALHLKEGDKLVYLIEGEKVVLSRARTEEAEDPFAVFGEWDSDADRRAYAGL
ncbi:MAG: transcriptional regulator [Treponema sp. GWB1_62_6]|nr:MAG: transcriptional regulator [Treponema sp. GWA1_62_8]OHE63072.1 MAG: transcriptional regulator [Treponema sp. GWC1_61_84]OHE70320.1 MAG: transcriptional regulator [Treponema sp. GWB1_62_6]OHE76784.1 MAG: transcriptional regulator [Treponema sp. RIFOXYC1_FULL_61_9]HCM26857.1 transcriptional regulator [Treponema sp.]